MALPAPYTFQFELNCFSTKFSYSLLLQGNYSFSLSFLRTSSFLIHSHNRRSCFIPKCRKSMKIFLMIQHTHVCTHCTCASLCTHICPLFYEKDSSIPIYINNQSIQCAVMFCFVFPRTASVTLPITLTLIILIHSN